MKNGMIAIFTVIWGLNIVGRVTCLRRHSEIKHLISAEQAVVQALFSVPI